MFNRNSLFQLTRTGTRWFTSIATPSQPLFHPLPALPFFQPAVTPTLSSIRLKLRSVRNAFSQLCIPTKTQPTIAQLLLSHRDALIPPNVQKKKKAIRFSLEQSDYIDQPEPLQLVASQLEKIINNLESTAPAKNSPEALKQKIKIATLKDEIELLQIQQKDFKAIVQAMLDSKASAESIHVVVPVVKETEDQIAELQLDIHLLKHPDQALYKRLSTTDLESLTAMLPDENKSPSFADYKKLIHQIRDQLVKEEVLTPQPCEIRPFRLTMRESFAPDCTAPKNR